eukprot:1361352-Lingulodinium_polyedra.AAC.1
MPRGDNQVASVSDDRVVDFERARSILGPMRPGSRGACSERGGSAHASGRAFAAVGHGSRFCFG